MLFRSELKAGSFKIAYKASVAIIPLALYGTFRPLKIYLHLKKYPISAFFFDAIEPIQYKYIQTTELAPKIQNMIQNKIDEERLLEDRFIINQKKMNNRV